MSPLDVETPPGFPIKVIRRLTSTQVLDVLCCVRDQHLGKRVMIPGVLDHKRDALDKAIENWSCQRENTLLHNYVLYADSDETAVHLRLAEAV